MAQDKPARFLIVALVAIAWLASCSFAAERQLTILHTNDHHGHFMKFDSYPQSAIGGMAAQSTLIHLARAEVEKEGGDVLVLSAGDVNTGAPESDLLDAEPDFKLMDYLGYDAMALGNHEFDNPREVLIKQNQWTSFPFLSANVFVEETDEPLVEPYVIKEMNGYKVAIFGLTTQETPILVLPDNIEGLRFEDPVAVAKKLAPELKKKADLVIALTHLGFYEHSGGGYRTAGDLLVAKEAPGIDVIVGGHSHTVVEEPMVVNETIIVQAGEWSKYVGRLDLVIDDERDAVIDYSYELLPVNQKIAVPYQGETYQRYDGEAWIEDERVNEKILPYMESASQLLNQPVGETLVDLHGDRDIVRSRETNLANLITDAMRAKTGAEIALLNAGGIRASIAKGPISYRDVLQVHPFGNILVLVDLTGAQLQQALDYAATIEPGNGAFLQVSGLRWTIQNGKATDVTIAGEKLDPNRTYKVITNNFLASGGDGYDMLKDAPQLDTGFVDADALCQYIREAGQVDPKVEGRLTRIE